MFIDFVILPSNFSDWEVTILAETDAAKKRFDGAVGINVRKSSLPRIADLLESEGFTVRTA
jgi:hypothetical protein